MARIEHRGLEVAKSNNSFVRCIDALLPGSAKAVA
jgi:hypothetical protein